MAPPRLSCLANEFMNRSLAESLKLEKITPKLIIFLSDTHYTFLRQFNENFDEQLVLEYVPHLKQPQESIKRTSIFVFCVFDR